MISIDEMVAFCRRKGFVFPSSELYGGIKQKRMVEKSCPGKR